MTSEFDSKNGNINWALSTVLLLDKRLVSTLVSFSIFTGHCCLYHEIPRLERAVQHKCSVINSRCYKSSCQCLSSLAFVELLTAPYKWPAHFRSLCHSHVFTLTCSLWSGWDHCFLLFVQSSHFCLQCASRQQILETIIMNTEKRRKDFWKNLDHRYVRFSFLFSFFFLFFQILVCLSERKLMGPVLSQWPASFEQMLTKGRGLLFVRSFFLGVKSDFCLAS